VLRRPERSHLRPEPPRLAVGSPGPPRRGGRARDSAVPLDRSRRRARRLRRRGRVHPRAPKPQTEAFVGTPHRDRDSMRRSPARATATRRPRRLPAESPDIRSRRDRVRAGGALRVDGDCPLSLGGRLGGRREPGGCSRGHERSRPGGRPLAGGRGAGTTGHPGASRGPASRRGAGRVDSATHGSRARRHRGTWIPLRDTPRRGNPGTPVGARRHRVRLAESRATRARAVGPGARAAAGRGEKRSRCSVTRS